MAMSDTKDAVIAGTAKASPAIEVTDAMIEAGSRALSDAGLPMTSEKKAETAAKVYRAMSVAKG